jgi:hypothetical protein
MAARALRCLSCKEERQGGTVARAPASLFFLFFCEVKTRKALAALTEKKTQAGGRRGANPFET